MDDSIDQIEYIIYCRKSTDESSDHQKQSIPDQIKACLDYAKREGLTIAKRPRDFSDFETEMDLLKEEEESDLTSRRIYEEIKGLFVVREHETAKIPYKRKKWRKLIEMTRKSKIGGIISYSPDRQSRNMLEAGEVIDLVDKFLVELRYANFHFENTPSGKMMLGIWFVFSKQYSDKLAEDITRGNKTTVEKGKTIGRYFPGYQTNKEGFHEPHPVNFPLMKEAFMRKLDGETDEKITNFLNANGYKKTLKKSEVEKEMNPKTIYKLWINEFYYGMFIHGETTTDLRETSSYYKPIISDDQHFILKERYNQKNKKNAYMQKIDDFDEVCPFENGFIRTEDDYGLTFNIPNKKRFLDKIAQHKGPKKLTLRKVIAANQIYYRCGNTKIKYYNYAVTAEKVDEAIMECLKSFRIGEKEFATYLNFATVQLKEIRVNTMEKISSKTLEINRVKKKKSDYIENNMVVKKDREEERIYERKKLDFEKKIKVLRGEIADLDEEERNEIIEIEAFINILNDADKYYKKATYVQKRKFTKILFSNIILDQQKRLHVNIKPGLESLFSLNGGPTWDRTRDQSVMSRLL